MPYKRQGRSIRQSGFMVCDIENSDNVFEFAIMGLPQRGKSEIGEPERLSPQDIQGAVDSVNWEWSNRIFYSSVFVAFVGMDQMQKTILRCHRRYRAQPCALRHH